MDNKNQQIENIRQDYQLGALNEGDVFENPIRQFQKWFEEAQTQQVDEVNAMTLATVTDGIPSARIVLLKGLDDEGFRFYTNYDSDKGQAIADNPNVALVFFWKELQRQVRIQGTAVLLPEQTSTEYFQSRPKGSQIGAWASPQSKIITDRSLLENNVKNLETEYQSQEALPRPQHWGGYVVKPYKIEFWQGRKSRLHDRLCYTLTDLDPQKWKIDRLAP